MLPSIVAKTIDRPWTIQLACKNRCNIKDTACHRLCQNLLESFHLGKQARTDSGEKSIGRKQELIRGTPNRLHPSYTDRSRLQRFPRHWHSVSKQQDISVLRLDVEKQKTIIPSCRFFLPPFRRSMRKQCLIPVPQRRLSAKSSLPTPLGIPWIGGWNEP